MEKKIAVIGLGYVDIPLAVEFAKKYPTIGLILTQAASINSCQAMIIRWKSKMLTFKKK